MSRQADGNNDGEESIDLITIFRILWDHKFMVTAIACVSVGVALYLALTAIPVFRAEIVVTEVSTGGMGDAASLVSQFGGLASLAGVKLPAAGGNREAKAILSSRRLAEEFVKRNELMSVLFPNASRPPTLWLAVQKFRESVLAIREDIRKGTTTVSIQWRDPAIAAKWANDFVLLANELVRVRAVDDSTRNIAFLTGQVERTNVVEVRRVMYNLIEGETKTLMLANARTEYAFTVIDPAVPPEQRISPKRTLMVVVGLVLGLFVGMLAAIAHSVYRGRGMTRTVRTP